MDHADFGFAFWTFIACWALAVLGAYLLTADAPENADDESGRSAR